MCAREGISTLANTRVRDDENIKAYSLFSTSLQNRTLCSNKSCKNHENRTVSVYNMGVSFPRGVSPPRATLKCLISNSWKSHPPDHTLDTGPISNTDSKPSFDLRSTAFQRYVTCLYQTLYSHAIYRWKALDLTYLPVCMTQIRVPLILG